MSTTSYTTTGEAQVRILCAPDSFKGSLTAAEVAAAMIRGIAKADPSIQCDSCPIADGGEGSLDSLVAATGGTIHRATVIGPSGGPVEARFGIVSGASADGPTLGIVELAEASGLGLVPWDRRDPTRTTTYGTGQLIRCAANMGCAEIIVCIGGSATVDGGAGLAQALGARFLDSSGTLIEKPLTGGELDSIARVEPAAALPRLRVACDVTNPLCGPNGAAAVYGPQKGATQRHVEWLDAGLAHLARILGADPTQPGFGAAGGAAMGLVMLCGATMERGIELVLNTVGFDSRCRGASLVLTGEGRLDRQSLSGKAVRGVAEAARRLGVPTIAIVGSTGSGWEECLETSAGGFLRDAISLGDRFGMQRALSEALDLIAAVAGEIARALIRPP